MKPVFQTRFGFEDGNCFEACIASILEIPLDDIPDFHKNAKGDNGPAYWKNIAGWCKDKPFNIIAVALTEDHDPLTFFKDSWVIVSGPSPRGKEDWHIHACVWWNGKIVHDPHPDQQGLKEITEYNFFIWKQPRIFPASQPDRKWHYFCENDPMCVFQFHWNGPPRKEYRTACHRAVEGVMRHTENKQQVTCLQCLHRLNKS